MKLFLKAYNLRVECYLDEIIVEVQIFLGLYLTINNDINTLKILSQ
jgi:hypothetical protein